MHDVQQLIAEKLRQLRQARGLTLDELVRCSGVSKGMLVEMEKGAANPSIATLCKVAAAFGVSVADLVELAPRHAIRVFAPADNIVLWQGPRGGYARLLAGSQGPQMLELWQWLLKPGESYDSAAHPAGSLELLHVISGELCLRVGDEEQRLSSGHSVSALTDQNHCYRNSSSADTVFFMSVLEPATPPLKQRRPKF